MQFVSLGQLVHLLSFLYEWSLAGTTFSQVDCDCVAYKVTGKMQLGLNLPRVVSVNVKT